MEASNKPDIKVLAKLDVKSDAITIFLDVMFTSPVDFEANYKAKYKKHCG